MTIKVKKEIEVDVELPLPAYYEYGSIGKIVSEQLMYCVDGKRIEPHGDYMVEHYIKNGKPTTEAAFNNAFQNALTYWNNVDREISLEKHNKEREPEEFEEHHTSVADALDNFWPLNIQNTLP